MANLAVSSLYTKIHQPCIRRWRLQQPLSADSSRSPDGGLIPPLKASTQSLFEVLSYLCSLTRDQDVFLSDNLLFKNCSVQWFDPVALASARRHAPFVCTPTIGANVTGGVCHPIQVRVREHGGDEARSSRPRACNDVSESEMAAGGARAIPLVVLSWRCRIYQIMIKTYRHQCLGSHCLLTNPVCSFHIQHPPRHTRIMSSPNMFMRAPLMGPDDLRPTSR